MLHPALHARTVQLKLRYSDFSTITRAHTFASPTQLDIDLIEHSRGLLRANWHGLSGGSQVWQVVEEFFKLSMVFDGSTKKFRLLIRKGDRHGLGFAGPIGKHDRYRVAWLVPADHSVHVIGRRHAAAVHLAHLVTDIQTGRIGRTCPVHTANSASHV